MNEEPRKIRFHFIDQFRGLVGVMMLLGHSNYYFNYVWKQFDPLDPTFGEWGQFALRYMGYLCAPGFLMMNGAMVWWAFKRRVEKGVVGWDAKWHLIQRGLFLVLVQVTWVNSSWSGFERFRPAHLGIIACIGLSMVFLTLIVNYKWPVRLGVALACFLVHPLLLNIGYDADVAWQRVIMQTFVDSGEWNKYPIIPWFGLATMGSVMASGWLRIWKTTRERFLWSLGIGLAALGLAIVVRLAGGYGNIWPFQELGHYSFFLDNKYPPSLYHNLWFFGSVTIGVGLIALLGHWEPNLPAPLGIVGKVPLFFYCVHIGILGVFSKRLGFFYHEGAVAASLFGMLVMLAVMMPLAIWFGRVKRKSRNYLIRMI